MVQPSSSIRKNMLHDMYDMTDFLKLYDHVLNIFHFLKK